MNASLLWFLPFGCQSLAMAVDEFGFHQRRGLPRLEWLGHALDTLAFLACLTCPLLLPPTSSNLGLFGVLAVFSCVLITKDEFMHQRLCTGGEHWLHALLFLLHPLVLIATAFLWVSLGAHPLAGIQAPPLALAMLWLQLLLVTGFLVYQLLFWACREDSAGQGSGIDNSLYETLGERWYSATDDPVALLRAESRLRTPWVISELRAHFRARNLSILDVACGGGFLANPLASEGYQVTGIDLSQGSLAVARQHDLSHDVNYLAMDARSLSFPDDHFDVVCMMDFLEHIEDRDAVLREAQRVLKPGGFFFFHTFNRTPLSGLVAIKGVQWFVRNTPRHMHIYALFLKPSELEALCARHQLQIEVLLGVRPRVFTQAFLQLLLTGRVSDSFQFAFTLSKSIGYCGRARKIS